MCEIQQVHLAIDESIWCGGLTSPQRQWGTTLAFSKFIYYYRSIVKSYGGYCFYCPCLYKDKMEVARFRRGGKRGG